MSNLHSLAVGVHISYTRKCGKKEHADRLYLSFWGTAAIKVISMRLQAELPGLRGFSERNLRNMRTFYEEWQALDSNSAVVTAELQTTELQGDIPLIIPDKPNSQHQKYRLIAKGLQLKELLEKNK